MDHLKTKAGIEVEDMGTDKYYVAAADVAKRVQDDKSTKGMLFCGTGMGVGIVANKFTGVYAATCENEAAARHSRSINNSNILAMGGLVTTVDDAVKVGGVLVSRRDRCHRHRHRRRYRRRRRRRRRRRHSPHSPPFPTICSLSPLSPLSPHPLLSPPQIVDAWLDQVSLEAPTPLAHQPH